MLSLSNLWLVASNKFVQYAAIALLVVVVVFRIIAIGADQERTKQLEAALKREVANAKARARIDAMSNAAAHDELRKRWSRPG